MRKGNAKHDTIKKRKRQSLNEDEVLALLDAPNLNESAGLRDRAMLELLYACGLRVSELVGVKVTEVSINDGVVRVTGKGSKTRLVPMGEEAVDWISRYLSEARPDILQKRLCDALFVTIRGEVILIAPVSALCRGVIVDSYIRFKGHIKLLDLSCLDYKLPTVSTYSGEINFRLRFL